MYTIGTAATATGKAKSTISRDIKSGKISATLNPDGSYSIDPAELHRVYPPVSNDNGDNGSSNPYSNDPQPPESAYETGVLQGELEQLRERLARMDTDREHERRAAMDQIADLRRRLDQAEQERRDKDRQLTALLTDQRPPAPMTAEIPLIDPVPAASTAQNAVQGGFFGRIRYWATGKR